MRKVEKIVSKTGSVLMNVAIDTGMYLFRMFLWVMIFAVIGIVLVIASQLT